MSLFRVIRVVFFAVVIIAMGYSANAANAWKLYQPQQLDPKTLVCPESSWRKSQVDSSESCLTKSFVVTRESRESTDWPFALTIYSFTTSVGESTSDYVLEFSHNGVRHALYTGVVQWELSDDGRFLYIENLLRNPDGQLQHLRRIIGLPTKTAVSLPESPCVGDAWWNGKVLMTIGHDSDASITKHFAKNDAGGAVLTPVCVWDVSGQRVAQWKTKLEWACDATPPCSSMTGIEFDSSTRRYRTREDSQKPWGPWQSIK